MPLNQDESDAHTTTTTTTTSASSDVATQSLLTLFSDLAAASVDAEHDAAALMRRNELHAQVAAALTSVETLTTLEQSSSSSSSSSGPLVAGSVAHCIVEAVSSRSPLPVRLVAMEQLAVFFSLTITADHRARLAAVLVRIGLPRVLVDECLCDESIEVSQAAIRLLLRWGGDPSAHVSASFFAVGGGGGDGAANDEQVAVCQWLTRRLAGCSDVVQMRFFELVVLLVTRNDAVAERALANADVVALLDALTATLAGDDILLQLNVVELVAQLCGVADGVRFCERRGILARFHALVGAEPDDPIARMYAALVIKCIGRFASRDVYNCAGAAVSRAAFVAQLARLVASAQDADLLAETFAALASLTVAVEPAQAAALADTVREHVVPRVTAHNRELSAAALYATASLVRRLGGAAAERFVQQSLIDDEPLLAVLRTRTLRHNETSKTTQRHAAFELLKAVAEQPWGVALLVNDADWFALLVSRESEVNTAGWHAKYDLVRTVEEQLVHARVDAAKAAELQRYLRQGAIFVPSNQAKPEVGVML